MGQIKNMLIEAEDKENLLSTLDMALKNKKFEYVDTSEAVANIFHLINQLEKREHNSFEYINLLSDILPDEIQDIARQICEIAFRDNKPEADEAKKQALVSELTKHLKRTGYKTDLDLIRQKKLYNSVEYYAKRISEAEQERDELQKRLVELQKETERNNQSSERERKAQALRIESIEQSLGKANQQISLYQSELEKKKKQENAVAEWNSKIKSVFTEMKSYLAPIKEEHNRLKYLFYLYLALTIIVIAIIMVLEIVICYKFRDAQDFPSWRDYIFIMLPIPVGGALLWAFISQLNRAQRQLVILAKHIHEIEYVEGLLTSLNSLSTDINDSMKRINAAIDRLLDNHLSSQENSCHYDEAAIIKEEKKDMIPYDLVLKLISEIKGLTK